MDIQKTWKKSLPKIADKVSSISFDCWIKTLAADSFADGTGVDNAGVIQAARAELAAHGDAYRLAVNNTGLVEARGVTRTPDGKVYLTATGSGGATGSVENAGTLRAVNADGSGGTVAVTGETVILRAGSLVDVSAVGALRATPCAPPGFTPYNYPHFSWAIASGRS